MSSHNPNLDHPLESTDSTEARMRQALGLGSRPSSPAQTSAAPSAAPAHDSNRQRRRFAQDGDVPVVMLHRGRDSDGGGENKLAMLSAELRDERAARLRADRALEEANLLVQSLKTKLKHAEMAMEERLRGESEARAQVDALLLTEREARQQAETKAAEATLAVSLLERKAEATAKPTPLAARLAEPDTAKPDTDTDTSDLFGEVESAAVAPKRRQGRKATVQAEPAPVEQEEDDKPIEWWLPSFRASRKTPTRRKRATG
jgi:hypothetical protein